MTIHLHLPWLGKSAVSCLSHEKKTQKQPNRNMPSNPNAANLRALKLKTMKPKQIPAIDMQQWYWILVIKVDLVGYHHQIVWVQDRLSVIIYPKRSIYWKKIRNYTNKELNLQKSDKIPRTSTVTFQMKTNWCSWQKPEKNVQRVYKRIQITQKHTTTCHRHLNRDKTSASWGGLEAQGWNERSKKTHGQHEKNNPKQTDSAKRTVLLDS